MLITPMDPPPSTPTRTHRPSLSVFSPRAPIKNAASPRPRLTAVARNVLLPTSCDLIICGIGARKPNSDTVKLLQNAVKSIMKDIPELADVPVVVKQFSTRGDWSSTAYISRSLPKPAPTSENEPRTDLLLAFALKGNSTRRLAQNFDYIPLPLAVNDLDDPEKLICSPEGVKATTMEYFRRLYDHSQNPTLPKPWMETPSVVKVRTRIAKDPFAWPRKASLADLRALLRRGNNRPSPGPDQWEKWTVKSLSDFALSRVLDLLNYQVISDEQG